MKIVLTNLALLFGTIGFAAYLFLILASALGCCTGVTTMGYHNLVMLILSTSVIIFAACMYNNCCRLRKKGK